MKRTSSRVLTAVLIAPVVATLAACGSSGTGKGTNTATASSTSGGTPSSGTPSSASPVAGANTKVGVKVDPKFGASPTLTIPGGAAPTKLTQQVLTQGTGKTLAAGDLLVANYLGQTWAPKSGKPNVFDSSFSRGAPAGFAIGEGEVITGWDKTLVGKKLGSRVLLTIPPADGYGSGGQPSANISGTDTLVFVVDLIAAYAPGTSAPGTVVANLPSSGLPKIENTPGKEPKILSTAGVSAPSSPSSTLLVKGSGAKIDSSKSLVMQFVEADLADGKNAQSTWQQSPQTASAQQVLNVATALKGQNIGSRAVILLPATAAVPGSATQASQAASPAEILIVDVVGQF
jgi:peptidylprolyl isomerase